MVQWIYDMIRIDFLIYTAVFWFLAVVTIALATPAEPNRGCIASAYQAETRGFDLQENLDACK